MSEFFFNLAEVVQRLDNVTQWTSQYQTLLSYLVDSDLSNEEGYQPFQQPVSPKSRDLFGLESQLSNCNPLVFKWLSFNMFLM